VRAVIGVVLAVVILCCGGGALWVGLQARAGQTAYPGGTTGTARVVSVATEISEGRRRRSTSYRPTYQFTTTSGRTATFTDMVAASEPPAIGSTVTISYQESRPEGARVVRGWHGWTDVSVFWTFLAALVITAAGFGFYRVVIRRQAAR
jgi:uncharacterized protein DUF3592